MRIIMSGRELRVILSENLKSELDNVTKITGESISSLVRRILKEYIDSQIYHRAERSLNIKKKFENSIIILIDPRLKNIEDRVSILEKQCTTILNILQEMNEHKYIYNKYHKNFY